MTLTLLLLLPLILTLPLTFTLIPYLTQMFQTYLQLGYDHILDINAYDHILFLIALCAIYRIRDWRKILILVTAFTIGHTTTLALSSLNIITMPSKIVEFLIPLTILVTALLNVKETYDQPKAPNFNYLLALFFGFVHGMGFSNYFKALLGGAGEIFLPLFAFNIGVELGQMLIVAIIMLLSFVSMDLLKIKQRSWNLFISGMAAGGAILFILESNLLK